MQYLDLALYAEGKTDYQFLSPLLQRLCEHLCIQEARQAVEVGPVLPLDHPLFARGLPRDERIVAAAEWARGAWRVLFVHADADGDAEHARAHRTQPAIESLRQHFEGQGLGVAVVPVRETEAWAIRDGEALRQVFGTTLSDTSLGLPQSAAAVEATMDPKAILTAAFNATRPSPQRRRQGISPLLNAIGEQVSLQRLREVSAFATLETELRAALKLLRVLA